MWADAAGPTKGCHLSWQHWPRLVGLGGQLNGGLLPPRALAPSPQRLSYPIISCTIKLTSGGMSASLWER